MSCVNYVDICCGLAWGDEAKGKIVSYLSKSKNYNFVCRWAGGNNAGHTIYIDGKKYKTHLIPSGVFYGIKSIIGPDCVVNVDHFFKEIEYLKQNNFDTNLIKISPKTHIITNEHLAEDKSKYCDKLGTTGTGIAPCYRDKYGRTGIRVCDRLDDFKDYLWDEQLYGNVLCEGAQGFWLDINYGNYPYITSSNTLPYSACSLGFPPQLIRRIYGAAKIYDTRAGLDPEFPDTLFDDEDLQQIGILGEEYGTTTGRKRAVNWLNLDKLIYAINISGTTNLVISKTDVIEKLNKYKFFYENTLLTFDSLIDLQDEIESILFSKCHLIRTIHFSNNNENI